MKYFSAVHIGLAAFAQLPDRRPFDVLLGAVTIGAVIDHLWTARITNAAVAASTKTAVTSAIVRSRRRRAQARRRFFLIRDPLPSL